MPSLSIVVPAYNERDRLPDSLSKIVAAAPSLPLRLKEVIIVDDGSIDGTADVATGFEHGRDLIRVLQNPGNRGKGYSVRHGMLAAAADWVLFTDADLSTPIEELCVLYKKAETTGSSVAIGSRALNRTLIEVHQSWFREYSGRIFNSFMRAFTGLPFADTQCGFKLYRADAVQMIFSRQKLDGFSFDVEDLFIAQQLSIPVVEVPVHWRNAEGSKVSLLGGLQSFTDVLKIWSYQRSGAYGFSVAADENVRT